MSIKKTIIVVRYIYWQENNSYHTIAINIHYVLAINIHNCHPLKCFGSESISLSEFKQVKGSDFSISEDIVVNVQFI